MSEIIELDDIKTMIYEIRGKQVILDNDVARLYNYKTKRINETVNRNTKRFPEEFCFRLTEEEYYMLLKKQDINLMTLQGHKLRP